MAIHEIMEGNRIGIVGGGQLGRMMTTPALEMGHQVTVLNDHPNGPASQVGAHEIVGGLKDPEAIRKLAATSDFLTWEIEHIDTKTLIQLQNEGHTVNPDPATLATIQNKLHQHEWYARNNIPTAEFAPVNSVEDLREIGREFGYPFMLKAQLGGYDGRGNRLVKSKQDVSLAYYSFVNTPVYAEKIVPFDKELAVIAARDKDGNVVTYPTVETKHVNNICHTVTMPAQIEGKIDDQAQELAMEVAKLAGGAGITAVEMYQAGDKVLVNESAPRVHNSGHATIEASETSQFEQAIRAVTGMRLGSTEMRARVAVMINILGEDGPKPARFTGLQDALLTPGVHVHLYGKAEAKPERKMGHITVVGSDYEEVYSNAVKARRAVSI